jgi:PleD family two-component response regulator
MRLEGMAAGSLGKGHAVLVVDDDADVREALAELVATSGRPVFTAADGGEALELLDADAVPRPCLVLLDLMMAPMDGRAFHTLPRELRPGVLGTLRKPFEVEELLAILDRHCPGPRH